MAGPVIVVANDDQRYLDLVARWCERQGFTAHVRRKDRSLLEVVLREHPQLLILDVNAQGDDLAWNTLTLLRLDEATSTLPVLVCSPDGPLLRAKRTLLRQLRCDVLEKPYGLLELQAKALGLLGLLPDTPPAASTAPLPPGLVKAVLQEHLANLEDRTEALLTHLSDLVDTYRVLLTVLVGGSPPPPGTRALRVLAPSAPEPDGPGSPAPDAASASPETPDIP